MTVPMNFTKETQYMTEFKPQKQGGNTLASALGADENMILKDIRFELEPRDSDLIRLYSKGYLESAFVKVWLDRSSIVDCLMAKDISQEAEVVFEMISTDRRSLRYTKKIKIKNFDFDDAIRLRLFNMNDVVQIKFKDEL